MVAGLTEICHEIIVANPAIFITLPQPDDFGTAIKMELNIHATERPRGMRSASPSTECSVRSNPVDAGSGR